MQSLNDAGNAHLRDRSFGSFLNASRRFLALYGVDLSVGTNSYHYDYNGRAPTAQELNSATAKRDVFGIMTALAAEPTQYPEGIGLKHIILMGNKKAGAAAYSGGDTIVYNIADDSEPADVWHEEGHLDDSLTCKNGTTNDPTFTQLNGGTQYYGYNGSPKPNSATVYPDYELKTASLWDQGTADLEGKDYAAACATERRIEAIGRHTVFISEYAGTANIEDKAELYAQIPDPNSEYNSLDPDTPRLMQKYELVFGRLFAAMPRVATFFSRLGANAGTMQICPTDTVAQTNQTTGPLG